MAANNFIAIAGDVSTNRKNSLRSNTVTVMLASAVTGALRRVPSSRDISPKRSSTPSGTFQEGSDILAW